MRLQFEPFHLDTDRAELRTATGPVSLEPKAYRLLCLLVTNTDRVVSKEEMIAVVWDGRFISDSAVATVLGMVRKALGDDGDAQRYIRTVRGIGHRFVAPVRIEAASFVSDPPAPAVDAAGPLPGRPTIAVLPFARAGLSDHYSTLGDAIPAEIISSLAKLRWLRVIARESTFRFRNAEVDLAALHSVLGASYCLSGHLEVFSGRLSATIDLVDTRTGGLIWSEHFERPLADVHAVRHEIVMAVIAALDLQIPQAEAALARTRPVEQLDAWQSYHLGLSHMYRFNARDNAIAAGLLARATDLDPSFATAFAARSFNSFQTCLMGYDPDRVAAMAATRRAAERSVELDPLCPNANAAMGRFHILSGAPDDGLYWLERSLTLSPNYAKGHYSRAFLQVLCGLSNETRQGVDVAMGLSPLDPMLGPMLIMKALSYGLDGDFATGAEFAVRGARIMDSHLSGLCGAIALCVLSGRIDDAKHWLGVLRAKRPEASINMYMQYLPFRDADFRASLAKALQRAGLAE